MAINPSVNINNKGLCFNILGPGFFNYWYLDETGWILESVRFFRTENVEIFMKYPVLEIH